MRIALIAILVFLWAIWFKVAEINYGEGFIGSKDWDRIGWKGFSMILVTGVFLFVDWLKKKNQRRSA